MAIEVIDLGIKVTPAQLIEAIRREKPDFVGLSGLLVKSAQQMVITAQDFKEAGIDIPILVGGAALSRRFTETKIAEQYDGPVIYSKDAMQGLEYANRIMNPQERGAFIEELNASREKRIESDAQRAARPVVEVTEKPVRTIARCASVCTKGFSTACEAKLFCCAFTPLRKYAYINRSSPWLKGQFRATARGQDERAVQLTKLVNDYLNSGELKASGMYQFYPAQADGDDVVIYSSRGCEN